MPFKAAFAFFDPKGAALEIQDDIAEVLPVIVLVQCPSNGRPGRDGCERSNVSTAAALEGPDIYPEPIAFEAADGNFVPLTEVGALQSLCSNGRQGEQ